MEHTKENCTDVPLDKSVLTMAFVNIEPFDAVYSLSDALKVGTLFPDLDKPLLKGRGKR